MRTRHFRASGEEVGGSEIEFYNFNFQDATFRGEPAQAGDKFTTECTYRAAGASTQFGLGSSEEMCIDFIGYYPRSALSERNQKCGLGNGGGSVTSQSITTIPLKFGVAGAPTPASPTGAPTTGCSAKNFRKCDKEGCHWDRKNPGSCLDVVITGEYARRLYTR